jgi:hypothetical protein
VRRERVAGVALRRRRIVAGAARFASTALLLAAGCRSTEPAGVRLSIDGSETVRAGAVVTLTPLMDDGSPVIPFTLTWGLSDSTIATLRSTGSINSPSSRELTGLRAGVVTVSVTDGELSGTRQVTVVDDRPVVQATIGQSVPGHLTEGVGEQRIALALAAGDTIDLSVTADSVQQNGMRLVSLDGALPLGGTLRSARTTFYGAVVAPRAGTYFLGVASGLKCTSWGSCSAVGPYTVLTRRSAPMLHLSILASDIRLPQGAMAADTAWLQNVGAGTLSVQTRTSVPWLLPDASSIAVPGPVAEPTPDGSIPAGSTAFTSTIDSRALAPGVYTDTVGFIGSPSTWGIYAPSGYAFRLVNVRVHDALARVMDRTTSLFALSAMPDGTLLGGNSDSLFTVDRVSGATTPLLKAAQSSKPRQVVRVVGGLDGVPYFGALTAEGDSLYRVVDGRAEAVTGWRDHWSGGFIVLADGTVYASHDFKLERISKNGAREVVASVPGTSIPQVLIHRPGDQALYFANRGPLRRYDIATGVLESRGAGNLESVLAVDAQGTLYASSGVTILALDTSGRELSRFVPPCNSMGVAVSNGVIYGACPGYFWTMPVR